MFHSRQVVKNLYAKAPAVFEKEQLGYNTTHFSMCQVFFNYQSMTALAGLIRTPGPIVVATTNHSKENEKLLKAYSKSIPILYSSNLSLAMNYFFKMVKQIKKLDCYDFVLEETHHKNKKDKPSGTCKTLIKNLNHQGIKPKVVSLRVSNVFGVHTLKVFGENETLFISHNVLSRQVFCEGAIWACKFLKDKKKCILNNVFRFSISSASGLP